MSAAQVFLFVQSWFCLFSDKNDASNVHTVCTLLRLLYMWTLVQRPARDAELTDRVIWRKAVQLTDP